MKFSELLALAPGSLIENGTLMPTITGEKVVHKVVQRSEGEGSSEITIIVESYFFEILVVRLLATKGENDKIKWRQAP